MSEPPSACRSGQGTISDAAITSDYRPYRVPSHLETIETLARLGAQPIDSFQPIAKVLLWPKWGRMPSFNHSHPQCPLRVNAHFALPAQTS